MSTATKTMIEVEQSTAALLQTLREKAAGQGLSLDALLCPLAEAPARQANGHVFTTLHPNQRWLQAHRESYRGQWIVLDQGELVAHGTDGLALAEAARVQGVPEPFLAFIPAEDLPFAGF